MSEKTLAERIRYKMGNMPGRGVSYNQTPLALDDLIKKFQCYDPNNLGYCTKGGLKRALTELNLSMGESHLDLMVDKFNVNQSGIDYFDYPRFCFSVYPGQPANATLPHHLSLQIRKPSYGGEPHQFISSLDFSQTRTHPVSSRSRQSQRSQRSQTQQLSQRSQRSQPQQSQRSQRSTLAGMTSSRQRELSARLNHSQRLKPLAASGRRTLAPSASMSGGLSMSQRSTQSRGLRRTASTPQFKAMAAAPGY